MRKKKNKKQKTTVCLEECPPIECLPSIFYILDTDSLLVKPFSSWLVSYAPQSVYNQHVLRLSLPPAPKHRFLQNMNPLELVSGD